MRLLVVYLIYKQIETYVSIIVRENHSDGGTKRYTILLYIYGIS